MFLQMGKARSLIFALFCSYHLTPSNSRIVQTGPVGFRPQISAFGSVQLSRLALSQFQCSKMFRSPAGCIGKSVGCAIMSGETDYLAACSGNFYYHYLDLPSQKIC